MFQCFAQFPDFEESGWGHTPHNARFTDLSASRAWGCVPREASAELRGEEEDVVFTCCFCCFQFRFDSTRMMVESELERGWWMVGKWLSRSSEEWMNCDWEMAGYGWSADGAMQRERGTFASPLCLCRFSAHQPGELPAWRVAKATSSAILRSGVLPLRSRTNATSREPTL